MRQKPYVILCLLPAFVLQVSPPALAGGNDLRERYERRVIQYAEMKRSEELGGYSNPIAALRDLFTGNLKAKDLQPGFSSYHEAREYLYSRGDRQEPRK